MKMTPVRLILFLLFQWRLLLLPISAAQAVPLPDIGKPSQLSVFKDRLYITEKASIYIYSLKDFRLLKKFGVMGEGPNEFKLNPFGPGLQLFPKGDRLIVNSDGKLSEITADGEFIGETRVNPFSLFIPAGSNYVGNAPETDQNQRMRLHIYLWNSRLEKIKSVYSTNNSIGTGLYSNLLFDSVLLPCESFVYVVYGGRVHIPAEEKGAVIIHVCDANGNEARKLGPLRLAAPPVTPEYQKTMRDWFKNHSPLHTYYEQIKHSIRFRERFPLFKNMLVDNDTIYLITHARINGRYECIVMNLKGERLKRIATPLPEEEPFAPVCYTIHNNTFYALDQNASSSDRELRIMSVKEL